MFPRALLIARVRRDGVRPQLLSPGSEEALDTVRSLKKLYREAVNEPRREVERRIRELEGKARNFKTIRGLSLLIERQCTFRQRMGPEPMSIRKALFDGNPGGTVTPEERDAAVDAAARTFGISHADVIGLMWADLEDEQLLVNVPEIDPAKTIERFNLGQCQTLLFNATQLTVSFSGEEALRESARRVKRAGLMFTALPGTPPSLVVEGTVSFVRSTERYGTQLARLLPSLLSLPGWKMEAMVRHTDSGGRKAARCFRLDSGVSDYLGIPEEHLAPPTESSLVAPLKQLLLSMGLNVEDAPAPIAVRSGLEFPDLLVTGSAGRAYVEAVGYWSSDWVQKKLKRTENAAERYVVVAPRNLSVGPLREHPRLLLAGPKGVGGKDLRVKVLDHVIGKSMRPSVKRQKGSRSRNPTLTEPVYSMADIADIAPGPITETVIGEQGYLVAGSFAIRKDELPSLRKKIREAMPELSEVEKVLERFSLNASVLGRIGFVIRWRGLDSALVEEA